jgi:hypothetical protein
MRIKWLQVAQVIGPPGIAEEGTFGVYEVTVLTDSQAPPHCTPIAEGLTLGEAESCARRMNQAAEEKRHRQWLERRDASIERRTKQFPRGPGG